MDENTRDTSEIASVTVTEADDLRPKPHIDESRAWAVYRRADRFLADGTLAQNVRDALNWCKTCVGLEVMALRAGQDEAASKLHSLAIHALGEAKRLTLLPYAQSGRRQSEKGREGHAKAYGTPEERAARDAQLARDFHFCFERNGSKELAYHAVARANGISDRLVREAVKNNKPI